LDGTFNSNPKITTISPYLIYGDGSKPWYLVNPKIAGKWMFIPLKMVLIGIDPYPYLVESCWYHILSDPVRIPTFATAETPGLVAFAHGDCV